MSAPRGRTWLSKICMSAKCQTQTSSVRSALVSNYCARPALRSPSVNLSASA